MRRDHALAKLPQLAAQIAAWERTAVQAKSRKDMTAWDDAQRNIRKLEAEKARLIQQYY